MNTIARLENVSQHFGATTALKDITLSIPARCMVGLIGARRRRQAQPAVINFRRTGH